MGWFWQPLLPGGGEVQSAPAATGPVQLSLLDQPWPRGPRPRTTGLGPQGGFDMTYQFETAGSPSGCG